MKIDVYATLNSVQEKELKESIVVVVDVLRASSTIITALYNGCREVIPTIEIEEAIRLAKNYEKDTLLLGGERNAQKIDGFDLSNSPSEYTREVVEGRTILITTTNGTRAIKKANDAKEVIIGGFLNAGVVSQYIGQLDENVAFLCAGTEGKFSLDDILAVGAIIEGLEIMDIELDMDDLALVCRHVYRTYKEDLTRVLKATYHYRNLLEVGYVKDVDDCIRLNAIPIVPIYQDGVISIIEKNT